MLTFKNNTLTVSFGGMSFDMEFVQGNPIVKMVSDAVEAENAKDKKKYDEISELKKTIHNYEEIMFRNEVTIERQKKALEIFDHIPTDLKFNNETFREKLIIAVTKNAGIMSGEYNTETCRMEFDIDASVAQIIRTVDMIISNMGVKK